MSCGGQRAAEESKVAIFPTDVNAYRYSWTIKGNAGLLLDGPHRALLVQGDAELGAFAEIHEKLYQANVNVYASTGLIDGRGSYGYVLHIRPEEYERAANALQV